MYGRLKDTKIPVNGIVEVREEKQAVSPVRKVVMSCADNTKLLPGSGFYDHRERVHSYLFIPGKISGCIISGVPQGFR